MYAQFLIVRTSKENSFVCIYIFKYCTLSTDTFILNKCSLIIINYSTQAVSTDLFVYNFFHVYVWLNGQWKFGLSFAVEWYFENFSLLAGFFYSQMTIKIFLICVYLCVIFAFNFAHTNLFDNILYHPYTYAAKLQSWIFLVIFSECQHFLPCVEKIKP